jgi:hypothetical protein
MKKGIQVSVLILWIVVIFVVMAYPSLEAPSIRHLPEDKLYHFAIFFVLGAFEYRIVQPWVFFLLGCSIIVAAEFAQVLSPGRHFELLDMLAGVFGLVASYVFFKIQDRQRELSKT